MNPDSNTMVRPAVIAKSDILSEDEINYLMYYRDKHTEGAFYIGDLACARVKHFQEHGFLTPNGKRVSATAILKEIGAWCGRARTTVHLYMQNALFYPIEVREKYSTLAFCHFSFAREADRRWGFETVLSYALGRPKITEEELFLKFPPGESNTERPTAISSEDSLDNERMDDDCVIIPPMYSTPSERMRVCASASTFLDACVRVRNELDEALCLIAKQELASDVIVAKDQIEAAAIALRRALPIVTKALNRQLR